MLLWGKYLRDMYLLYVSYQQKPGDNVTEPAVLDVITVYLDLFIGIPLHFVFS